MIGKSFIKEIKEFDYSVVLISLLNTKKPDLGLELSLILENVNLLLKKEKNYDITLDKLLYILEDLKELKCVELENNKWYLADKIVLK